MNKLIIACLAFAALVILMGGCGSAGEDEATAQLTKAQFMKKARAVCAQTQEELRAVVAEPKVDYGKFASALGREAEALDAISGPVKVESKVEPLIENVAEASETVAREKQAAVEDPDASAYKEEASELRLAAC